MAGLGRKVWAADEVLAAADLQGYVQDQTVMVYNDASARSAGILTPTEGMYTTLKSDNILYTHNGTDWVGAIVGSAGSATTAAAADYATTAGTAVNANKVGNRTIFVQSSTPTANATDDLWFY